MPFAWQQAKVALRQLGIDLSVARVSLQTRPVDFAAAFDVPALNTIQRTVAEAELPAGPSLLLPSMRTQATRKSYDPGANLC